MRIQLIPEKIIDNSYSEEQLLDYHTLESIYVIRSLKALSESQEKGFIEADIREEDGLAYSEKYQIWFTVETFNIL